MREVGGVLSKQAKFRIQHMKPAQLKRLSDAVTIMESAQVITVRRAIMIDRYIETHGGRKAKR
jgi:hypothetical protein